VPFYVNAQALLSDVRLRLDALGEDSTVLVVEGNDDKRLFYRWIVATADIVPAGGKVLLRSALQAIRNEDKGRILFLTDCDYDVAAGMLHGGPDIVITATCDVESDLVSLGILEKLAVELVPLRAAESQEEAARIGTDVREHVETVAVPLGRIRMAAQTLGVDLKLEKMDLSKYWDRRNERLLWDKLTKVVLDHLREQVDISGEEWAERIVATPSDVKICHGKDMVNAAQYFFHILYKVDNKVTADMLMMMMRLALDQLFFEKWAVVHRMRKWETVHGRYLLLSALASK
jgi:hypothetical protein